MDSVGQVIVNEYTRGQSIGKHLDKKMFGNLVCSLSLLESTVMQFDYEDSHLDLVLPPRSVLLIMGDARWKWTHGIKYHKGDRRVSITFRSFA